MRCRLQTSPKVSPLFWFTLGPWTSPGAWQGLGFPIRNTGLSTPHLRPPDTARPQRRRVDLLRIQWWLIMAQYSTQRALKLPSPKRTLGGRNREACSFHSSLNTSVTRCTGRCWTLLDASLSVLDVAALWVPHPPGRPAVRQAASPLLQLDAHLRTPGPTRPSQLLHYFQETVMEGPYTLSVVRRVTAHQACHPNTREASFVWVTGP